MLYTPYNGGRHEDRDQKDWEFNSLILPKELLAKLQLKQGDVLFVTELAEGGIKLVPHDPTFERGMEIARKAMKTYRNALRELAK
jgi:putative addiction module antidote